MSKPRRRLLVAAGVIVLLGVALLAYALGAEAVSLILGGGVVAAAFVVLLTMGTVTPRKGDRRQRRRQGMGDARRQGMGERGSRASAGVHGAAREARVQGRRTVEAIEAAELRLFSQLEALDWLRAELQLARPLPPTRGFAAAPDALLELVRLVDQVMPAQVLELGSGVSTIVIARRLQQIGSGRAVALEHLPEHAERTRAELAARGLGAVARVVDAPLVEVRLGGGAWRWYELGDDVPSAVDVVFVDGPPGGTGSLARYPALPLLRERLVPGASILVDDGDRPDEREMVRRWQAEVDGLQADYLSLSKGAWLLRMPGG